ncbi:MAG TPA: hypothetical protein VKC63_02330 [Solirubrobacterales bacterium]|nr:hypothetical protein [Solirubrobacterales bacterium]
MASAMTAGAAATGIRAWLAAHQPNWISPRRFKLATAAILAVGVLASGTHLAPNGSGSTAKAASNSISASR